jgi:REP element-mobilizing transposase RayT
MIRLTQNELKGRRTTRLAGYDYTQPGAYFVTICSYQRKEIFGKMFEGILIHTPASKIAIEQWFITAEIRSGVDLYENEFIVMPNHIHGVIHLD